MGNSVREKDLPMRRVDLADVHPALLVEYDVKEPVVCACFGCGKILNHCEQLYGRYCFHHAGGAPADPTKHVSI
jgi:hypothetical protein